MIILDTNVVSELMKRRSCAPEVVAWADSQRRDSLVVTAITLMELYSGAMLIETGERRNRLLKDLEIVIEEWLGRRVLAFDGKAAIATAGWYAKRRRMGRRIGSRGAQIAGIAIARRIAIATRDVGDFDGIDVKVMNPWAR
jgi:predicted nucleic acid-binding protein